MQRQIAYDAPSFLFTWLHKYSIEQVLTTVILALSVIVYFVFKKILPRSGSWLAIGILLISVFYVTNLTERTVIQHNKFGAISDFDLRSNVIKPHSAIKEVNTAENYFTDELGRILSLRGVNFGGGSKTPSNANTDTSSPLTEEFFDFATTTFEGRPVPLTKAEEHFRRLSYWGFSFIRLLVTWEAIEHEGPGKYDLNYLAYIKSLVQLAAKYNISCFLDYHQDVWSRWTGGDGAPGWTLELVGFDLRNLHATQAAFLHSEHIHTYNNTQIPKMSWVTNYGRLGAATMFTLFFAGNEYAPKLKIEGEPIQDYLQRHYIETFNALMDYVSDEWNVVGFDLMNEPSEGFVGNQDLGRFTWPVRSSYVFTPFQAFMLGSGHTLPIDFYSDVFIYGRTEMVNPEKKSAWLPNFTCVWKMHGVWKENEAGEPVLLEPNYFATRRTTDKPLDFLNDFLKPFYLKVAETIHKRMPNAIIFMEPSFAWGPIKRHNMNFDSDHPQANKFAWAPHFYDGIQLLTKSYRNWIAYDALDASLILSSSSVIDSLTRNIRAQLTGGVMKKNHLPGLIGEIGIAMDMNIQQAYSAHGDFSLHLQAANSLLRGLENNLASFTWWTYVYDNNNQKGDRWNGEDLSIYSENQRSNPDNVNSGGRAIEVLVRPYARKISGVPVSMSFDPFSTNRKFLFEFTNFKKGNNNHPTEIFVPHFQYPFGIEVTLSDGKYEYDTVTQTLFYHHDPKVTVHSIQITTNSVSVLADYR